MLVVIALMRRTDGCKLQLRKIRFYKAQLGKMISKGLPAGIQGSMFSISNVVIQSSINSFGDIFMSGNAAASNIEGFAYVCMNAFHQTALNFVGQNVGAGQYKRVSRIAGICLGCVTVVGLVVGGAVYGFAPQLLSIYITDSAEAIGYGVQSSSSIDRDNLMKYIMPQDLKSFGLIPELVGRLPVLTYMQPLSNEALRSILTEPKNAIVKQYEQLFAMDGVKLTIEEDVLDYIVAKADEYKLGARGLRSICEAIMMDAMYDVPSSGEQQFTLTLDYAKKRIEGGNFLALREAI